MVPVEIQRDPVEISTGEISTGKKSGLPVGFSTGEFATGKISGLPVGFSTGQQILFG